MQVIETMEKMIKDILAAARTQMLQNNGGMRPADIGEITAGIIQNQNELAESKNISIHMTLEQGLLVNLEQALFSKALANVINNAIGPFRGGFFCLYHSRTIGARMCFDC